MEQQWETCVLYLNGITKYQKALFNNKEGLSYDCQIWYCSPTGDVILELLALNNVKDLKPFNPFDKAMGLLGGAGWELVTVQHATPITSAAGGHIAFGNIVAYFKRPVLAGRAVNEPKLVL